MIDIFFGMSALPKVEVYLYFSIWTTGVIISLYRLFLVGQVFDHRFHDQYHYEDFKQGWSLLGNRFQDQADYEWNCWTNLMIILTPFLICNLIGAEFLRYKKNMSALPLWYVGITISFLLLNFNKFITLWFIIQTLVYCICIHFRSYTLTWIISFLLIHYLQPEMWFCESDNDQYIIMVCSSWMVLRCISYSVDKIRESHWKSKVHSISTSDILLLLSYSFYLPTMFCGPFIPYKYFNEGVKINVFKWSYRRLLNVFKDFLRCGFWFTFTSFALHFIYVNAILLRPYFVKHLLDWELAGLGIAMGHFFHLKYMVFYGIPCAWAAAEGFTTPKLPCCVSRIHLYSYMWRRFDQGLYQFLVRYIYVPIITQIRGKNILRKTTASVACFAFMFVWHGEQDYVFFWVLFNFFAVTLEVIFKHTCNLSTVRNFLDKTLSPGNQIRVQCLLAAPLHCFSMISNYFFIGNGIEIGFIYFNRVYHGSLLSKLTILFFLYGAGQSAVAAQNWEHRYKKNKLT